MNKHMWLRGRVNIHIFLKGVSKQDVTIHFTSSTPMISIRLSSVIRGFWEMLLGLWQYRACQNESLLHKSLFKEITVITQKEKMGLKCMMFPTPFNWPRLARIPPQLNLQMSL